MLNDKFVKWLSRPTTSRGTNAVTTLPVTLITDIGLNRSENQDRVIAMKVNTMTASSRPFVVIALVDGMGGMWNGAECAIRSLSAFLNAIIRFRHTSPIQRLEMAADIANNELFKLSKARGGATLSVLLVTSDQEAYTLNIGDSRIYATVAGGEASEVIRLTVDDTLEEMVGGSGKELLQFMGMGFGLKPHIDKVPQNVEQVLITTDGIHFIRHETLCDTLVYAQSTQEAAEQLVTLASWRGAPDNASLAITRLPELFKCLSQNDESGVEIWDPFGALNILWLKQEHESEPLNARKLKDNTKLSVASVDGLQQSNEGITRSKLPKKTRKVKVPKNKVHDKAGLQPQLKIEIVSNPNQGNDNDSSR